MTSGELLGETILPTEVRQAAYGIARRLPGVEPLTAVTDQLGRPGHGLVELDADGNRRELIFADDYQLLGYQLTLLNPDWDYAPQGTLISWTAYLVREWADQLPARRAGDPPARLVLPFSNTRDGPPARCAMSVPVCDKTPCHALERTGWTHATRRAIRGGQVAALRGRNSSRSMPELDEQNLHRGVVLRVVRLHIAGTVFGPELVEDLIDLGGI